MYTRQCDQWLGADEKKSRNELKNSAFVKIDHKETACH